MANYQPLPEFRRDVDVPEDGDYSSYRQPRRAPSAMRSGELSSVAPGSQIYSSEYGGELYYPPNQSNDQQIVPYASQPHSPNASSLYGRDPAGERRAGRRREEDIIPHTSVVRHDRREFCIFCQPSDAVVAGDLWAPKYPLATTIYDPMRNHYLQSRPTLACEWHVETMDELARYCNGGDLADWGSRQTTIFSRADGTVLYCAAAIADLRL